MVEKFSEADLCKYNITPSKKDTMLNPKTTSPNCFPSTLPKVIPLSGALRQRGSISGLGRKRCIRAGQDFRFGSTLVTSISTQFGLEPKKLSLAFSPSDSLMCSGTRMFGGLWRKLCVESWRARHSFSEILPT